AVDSGHILARQNQCNWMVAPLQRNAPSDSRLIGIAWTNNREARNRTQTGKLLHRLMSGSVLSQRNAVVCENIDHVPPHQRGQADRWTHVIGENQKRGT